MFILVNYRSLYLVVRTSQSPSYSLMCLQGPMLSRQELELSDTQLVTTHTKLLAISVSCDDVEACCFVWKTKGPRGWSNNVSFTLILVSNGIQKLITYFLTSYFHTIYA